MQEAELQYITPLKGTNVGTERPIRIELFGGLRIRPEGGEPAGLPTHQPGTLLAYLALNLNRSHSREEMIAYLWPEEEPEIARKRLRDTLYALRRHFEQPPFSRHDILRTTRTVAGLNPDLVSTDVAAFEEALRLAGQTNDLTEQAQLIAQADGQYRGELLPGFYLDCFAAEQRRLAALHAGALQTLIQTYERLDVLDKASEVARRAIVLYPLMEEAHCALMRYHAASGQPSAVRRAFQELERVLREELGEEPSQVTRRLTESLLQSAQQNLAANGNGVDHGAHSISDGANGAPSAYTPAPSQSSSFHAPHRSTPRPRLRSVLSVAGIALLLALTWYVAGGRAAKEGASSANPSIASTNHPAAVPEGKVLWAVRYQARPDEKDSEPTAMTVDAAGNIYITGCVETTHNNADYLTLKYGPDGTLLWRRRYHGPGKDVHRATSITVDTAGNVYVTGVSDNGKGNGLTRRAGMDYATIKYDAKGNPLWVARYNGPADGEDRPVKVCVDGQGRVYVTGWSLAAHGSRRGRSTFAEWATVQYSPNGKEVWVRREHMDGPGDAKAADMVVDADGHLYVTGSIQANKNFVLNWDCVTIKYASNGHKEWEQHYCSPTNGSDIGKRIALDGSGHVYVAGNSDTGDPVDGGGNTDVLLLQYDLHGNQSWVRTYDSIYHLDDAANALAVDKSGNACVAGPIRTANGYDYVTLKYDVMGDLKWVQTYNGRASGDDIPYGLALDRRGRVTVTGCAFDGSFARGAGEKWNSLTLRYDANGKPLWKGDYDEGFSGTDWETAVAIDRGDNVIVTGQSDNNHHSATIVTVKYAP